MFRRAIVLATLTASSMITALPAAQAACTGRWTELPGAEPLGVEGIAALAQDDAWNVGTDTDGNDHGRAYHWDGVGWTEVPIPGGVTEYIWGIGAIAPHDVWIVGDWQETRTSGWEAYAAYWDGSRFVQTPVDAGPFPRLFDADGVASDDAWAVGFHAGDHGLRSLAMHWDGVGWTEVATPAPSRAWTYLHDVSAFATDDVWAVGYIEGRRKGRRPLAMHWDGATWTRTWPVNPPESLFTGVAATARNRAWAVGYSDAGALIERWNGSEWRRVGVPDAGRSSSLGGVSAVSRREAWAVGGASHTGPLLYR